ncbi:MAG: hypothetical protein KAT56_07665 [Sedimentisphaerales bacterium]|nr:hypothetical protein [Sedimentisphaerales bacterium]
MRKTAYFIISMVLLCPCFTFAAGGNLPGSGTEADPYRIEDRADFDAFADPANASTYWSGGIHTKLTCDLDLSGDVFETAVIAPDTDSTSGGFQGTSFTGKFDGDDHTISNLTIDTGGANNDYLGLFGKIGPSGQVRNLGLEDGAVTGGFYDFHLGGLVGANRGSITNCYATCVVTGRDCSYYLGGLVGYSYEGSSISNCYATGAVTGIANCGYLGGLVGCSDGNISNCYSTGDVSGNDYIGGLVGKNRGIVMDCYSTGDVSGHERVGGLVGFIVGYDECCIVSNCFWDTDTQTHGITRSIGEAYGAVTNVEGLTTGQMQTKCTFTYVGWDFTGETVNGIEDLWRMPHGGGYPILSWQRDIPGDFAGSYGVDLIDYSYFSGYWMNDNCSEVNDYCDGTDIDFSGAVDIADLEILFVHWLKGEEIAECRYGGGTGDPCEPYLISDPCHLDYLGFYPCDWGKSFRLTADIDMSGYSYEKALIAPDRFSSDGFQGTSFTGEFDGDGHVISNLTIDTSGADNDYLGLFGQIDPGGQVRKLGLENGAVTGAYGSRYLGGLVGKNYGSLINCYATGDVIGNSSVGGLVGNNYNGSIINCYATSAVTSVKHGWCLGGLVGYNYTGSIIDCYAIGAVNIGDGGYYLGGLVGSRDSGDITGCFWDGDTSGLCYSAGGWKKSTTEMMSAETYIGWNDGSWVIDEGNDYPHLSWEKAAQGLPNITTDYPERTYPGNGQDQPFELDSSEDIVCMSLRQVDWDKNFIVTSDIDMSSVTDYYPVSGFFGYIDGSGQRIMNLTVEPDVIGNRCLLGFIGKLSSSGRIDNLVLENVNINGKDYSYYLGGLVGKNYGSVTDCYATSVVTSGDYGGCLGGLMGKNYGSVKDCYTTGVVTSGDYGGGLGGLVGYNMDGSVSDCYSTGSVSGNDYLGGLVGYNMDGSVSDCYSTGSVSGDDCVGGLVGHNRYSSGNISNCYSTGDVSGVSNVGGMVGKNYRGSVSNCFWDTETQTHGVTESVGQNDGGTVTNVAGLTTGLMQTESTFTSAGWDFSEGDGDPADWKMPLTYGYPQLTWELDLIADIVPDGIVNLVDFSKMAEFWLGYAPEVDIYHDGKVDIQDLSILAENWLSLIVP